FAVDGRALPLGVPVDRVERLAEIVGMAAEQGGHVLDAKAEPAPHDWIVFETVLVHFLASALPQVRQVPEVPSLVTRGFTSLRYGHGAVHSAPPFQACSMAARSAAMSASRCRSIVLTSSVSPSSSLSIRFDSSRTVFATLSKAWSMGSIK